MQKPIAIVIALLGGASFGGAQSLVEDKLAAEHETKIVTGAPYSAKALTTSTQTLADGTKITRTITALLARDSDGRTRREQSMNPVGPWVTNAKENMIFIHDPVAQKSYVLDPKGPTVTVSSLSSEQSLTQDLKAKLDAEQVKIAAMKLKAAIEGSAMVILKDSGKFQKEELGEQVIEGVRAKGVRFTHTIAVGEIGNDHPIQIVSEVWHSDDLQVVVLSKRIDPRTGETEYRLTEISRAEPARSLFEVPAGYSLRQEIKRD